MKRILSKIRLQLYKIANRTLFFLRFPYLKPSIVLGFSHTKLPLFFSAGKGLKLIVTNPLSTPAIEIAQNVWIGDDVEFNTSGESKIVIKPGASVQDRCKLIGNVVLSRNVILAPNVFISSGGHEAFARPHLTIREQDKTRIPSNMINVIEEDCWLGINVFVKAGVNIGRGCVIGANSTISKDVPPYSVVVGNGRIIKNRIEFQPTTKISSDDEFCIPYFYRGFDFSNFEWDQDNLSVFAETNLSRVKIELKSPSDNLQLGIFTNVGLSGNIQVANGLTTVEIPLKKSESLTVPALLQKFVCIKIESSKKMKIRSMEIL